MNDQDSKHQLEPTQELRADLAQNRELMHHARNFLLAGGLLAGHSDGELSTEEQDYLLGALAALFDDPDDAIERLDSAEAAIELLQISMAWLELNGGDRRLELYRHLAAIVAADGVLDQNELRYMRNIAKGLGIPQADAREMIEREFSAPE